MADREIAASSNIPGSSQPQPLEVVILGDHLPPLSWQPREIVVEQLSRMSMAERSLRSRRVPLAVWGNFHLQRRMWKSARMRCHRTVLRKLNLEPTQLPCRERCRAAHHPSARTAFQDAGGGRGPPAAQSRDAAVGRRLSVSTDSKSAAWEAVLCACALTSGLRPHLARRCSDVGRLPVCPRRRLCEQVLRACQHRPHIVSVLQVGEVDCARPAVLPDNPRVARAEVYAGNVAPTSRRSA